ncbi:MAG: hypothetical protein AAFY28_02835 [Actinomycetota bacterium]
MRLLIRLGRTARRAVLLGLLVLFAALGAIVLFIAGWRNYALAAGLLLTGWLATIALKSTLEVRAAGDHQTRELRGDVAAMSARLNLIDGLQADVEQLAQQSSAAAQSLANRLDRSEQMQTDNAAAHGDMDARFEGLEAAMREQGADRRQINDALSEMRTAQEVAAEAAETGARERVQLDERVTASEQVVGAQLADLRAHSLLALERSRGPRSNLSDSVSATERSTGSAVPDSRALVVNSIPKAGSYLVAGLLSELGWVDSGLHYRDRFYWDFLERPLREVIGDPNQFKRTVPFELSLGLLDQRCFALAHLEQPEVALEAMRRSRVSSVLLVRDVHDCLVSMMRFLADERRWDIQPQWARVANGPQRFLEFLRHEGVSYLSGVERQAAFIETGIPVLRYEDLYGASGEEPQRAAIGALLAVATEIDASVEWDGDAAMRALNERVLGRPNRTYAGQPSRIEEYRSEAVDERLDELGVHEVNRLMGY